MSDKFYVYKIENKVNGKVYIGKTNNPKKRWYRHVATTRAGKEKAPKDFFVIHAAMKKYGIDNFEMKVIEECISEDQAYELEEKWMESFQSFRRENGYNIDKGDRHNKIPSKETIKKISMSLTGDKNHFYGKNHSDATKEQISIKTRGNSPNTILTENDVIEIKYLLKEGTLNNKQIGEKFGVSGNVISGIKIGRSWKHVIIGV